MGVKELEAALKRNCDLVGPAGKGGSYDLSAVALTKARRCDCLLPMEFLARLPDESPQPSPIWNADDCHRDWPLEQFEKIAACSTMSAVRYLSEMLKPPQLVEFGDGLGQVPKCLDFGVAILARRPLKATDPGSGLAAT